MIVVSDNLPLQYLVPIECIDILPVVYGRVLTTPQVMEELSQEKTPSAVRAWAIFPPGWLRIEKPASVDFLDRIDVGEASAISLAKECGAGHVLIDEWAGTATAKREGMQTVGTLGVLVAAGLLGLVDFNKALTKLARDTSFYASPALITAGRQLFHNKWRKRVTD